MLYPEQNVVIWFWNASSGHGAAFDDQANGAHVQTNSIRCFPHRYLFRQYSITWEEAEHYGARTRVSLLAVTAILLVLSWKILTIFP